MAQDGINLEYGKIEEVSGLLSNANAQIVPQINNLRTRVNTLVEDGMVFKTSSDTIRNLYNTFDSSLQDAVQGIKEFSLMFDSIEQTAKDFDQGIKDALPS
jgi:phage-related protein